MSDPRLPQLYEDVNVLARHLREVAEEHVRRTPPEDALGFVLIISSPESQTAMFTFKFDDGPPDLRAALAALVKVSATWLLDEKLGRPATETIPW